jgi:arginine decarboxylase
LKYFLGILQTSSPSYLIMASLDIARALLQDQGEAKLDILLSKILRLKEKSRVKPYRILGKEYLRAFELDETRITVCVKGLGISGYSAETLLREHFGIQVEMSDLYNIVCIAVPSDTEKNLDRLFESLDGLAAMCSGANHAGGPALSGFGLPEQRLGLAEAIHAGTERIKLDKAFGRVSRDIVAPYPPGIPVLCPGEVISGETVEYLKAVMASGGMVNGISENNEINVVK